MARKFKSGDLVLVTKSMYHSDHKAMGKVWRLGGAYSSDMWRLEGYKGSAMFEGQLKLAEFELAALEILDDK